MNKALRSVFSIVVLLAGAFVPGPASGGVPAIDGEELLNKKYGPTLTREILLSALYDDASSVRTLAAAKLVAAGEPDTLPFILEALRREDVPGAQIALAVDLGRLGDPTGVSALKRMCGEPGWSASLRMSAAQAMDLLKGEDCLPEILNFLKTPDDSQATWLALNSLLYHHEHASEEQIQEIRRLIPVFLNDNNLIVRMDASGVLAKFGDDQSVLDLKTALAREENDSGRESMSDAIHKLETWLAH